MLDIEFKDVRPTLEQFVREHHCTVLVTPDTERLVYCIGIRIGKNWSERHEIPSHLFTDENIIKELNAMYEELTKGATA